MLSSIFKIFFNKNKMETTGTRSNRRENMEKEMYTCPWHAQERYIGYVRDPENSRHL